MLTPDHSSTSVSSRIAPAPELTTTGTTIDKYPTFSPEYPARILVTVQTTETSTWLCEYTHSTLSMLVD